MFDHVRLLKPVQALQLLWVGSNSAGTRHKQTPSRLCYPDRPAPPRPSQRITEPTRTGCDDETAGKCAAHARVIAKPRPCTDQGHWHPRPRCGCPASGPTRPRWYHHAWRSRGSVKPTVAGAPGSTECCGVCIIGVCSCRRSRIARATSSLVGRCPALQQRRIEQRDECVRDVKQCLVALLADGLRYPGHVGQRSLLLNSPGCSAASTH